ncbi:hypothetical protein BC938DRAFT_475498, partial [Jimgerdemannia flammicorona]
MSTYVNYFMFSPPNPSHVLTHSYRFQQTFRVEKERALLKSSMEQALSQARNQTPGYYAGRLSRNNNFVVPVVPRLPPPPTME